MRRNITFIVLAAVVGLGIGVSAQAATIVSYENDALVGGATSAPTNVVDNRVSATAITFAPPSASNQPDTIGFLQNDAGISTLALAIAGDEYFTLTITPSAGRPVTYESLDLIWGLQNNFVDAGTEYTLLYDGDSNGFDTGDSLGVIANTGDQGVGASFGTASLDFTDFTNTGAVEFRIYAHNIGSTNPVTRIGIGRAFATDGLDDLVINGIAPEPASLLTLMGLGALMMSRRKRR